MWITIHWQWDKRDSWEYFTETYEWGSAIEDQTRSVSHGLQRRLGQAKASRVWAPLRARNTNDGQIHGGSGDCTKLRTHYVSTLNTEEALRCCLMKCDKKCVTAQETIPSWKKQCHDGKDPDHLIILGVPGDTLWGAKGHPSPSDGVFLRPLGCHWAVLRGRGGLLRGGEVDTPPPVVGPFLSRICTQTSARNWVLQSRGAHLYIYVYIYI